MRARAGLATLLVALALPATAGAYVIGGHAWPGHRISYFNADKKLARAVALAARAWNTSGVRVHFVAVPRARAEVIIRAGNTSLIPAFPSSEFDSGACAGFADLGWYPRHQAHVTLDRSCSGLIVSTMVTTHELGHILGLNHATRGCAVMSPSPYTFCRSQPKDWQYRCHYLQADDLRGALRLYGGRAHAKPDFCQVWPAPKPPVSLAVDPGGGSVSWRNPPLPKPALAEFGKPEVEASLGVSQGPCTPQSALAAELGNSARMLPSQAQTLALTGLKPDRPGTWCYTLQLRDRYGRGGSAQSELQIPNQPPVASFSANAGYGDGCIEATDSSTDSDGSITAWHWDFGAPGDPGNTSEDRFYTGHCYTQSGTYTVTLTVTDDLGATATATRQVTVEVQPPQ